MVELLIPSGLIYEQYLVLRSYTCVGTNWEPGDVTAVILFTAG